MKTFAAIFFVIHILAIAGIVILLLLQGGKENKVVPKGLIHAGITALVAAST
jgi:preprotein translocase subunit SecG